MSPRAQKGLRPGSFWTLFNRPGGWFFIVFLAAFATGAWTLQWRYVQAYEKKPWIDSFTIPEAGYVKTLACGYDKWVADMLFLRAIQAYGGVYQEGLADNYDPVYNFFNVVSTLDSGFTEAYEFGNLVIGDEGKDYHRALTYLDYGERHNWQSYSPWSEAAFTWVDAVKDRYPYREWKDLTGSWLWLMSEKMGWHDRARFHVRMAARCPDAPDWMGRWEIQVDKEEGLFEAAMFKWALKYAQGVEEDAYYLIGIGERNIILTAHDWHQDILSKALEKFREEQGEWPADFQEMDDKGYLAPVPLIDPQILLGHLKAYEEAREPIEPVLEQLFDISRKDKGGVLPCLQPDDEEFVILHGPKDQRKIGMVTNGLADIKMNLERFRPALRLYLVKNREYPLALDDAIVPHTGFAVPEPFGNGWFYDPETGEVRSNTYPLYFQDVGFDFPGM